jgi:DNA replication and repair protein RecF
LKQRNALLKRGDPPRHLDPWDQELATTGEILTTRRLHYLERVQEQAIRVAAEVAPGLGMAAMEFSPGWRRHEISLDDALLLARDRDRQCGYTSVGPHRADWMPVFEGIPGRDALSRGQAKLTALACLLAQAGDFAEIRQEWPVIALDDIAAELDLNHQQRLLDWLTALPAQVLITATTPPLGMRDLQVPLHKFHVERASVLCLG